MPIYMKIDGVRGDVTRAGSNGGVWKTTNFLSNDAVASGPTARPKIKVFVCPSDTSAVQVSRISLSPSGGGVEGRDPAASFKLEQLIDTAKNQGPTGKLYIATDAGAYPRARRLAPMGRLLVGTDGGTWRSGGIREAAANMKASNNLNQHGLGAHRNATVEIIVTDARGGVISTHRLPGASVTGSTGGTFTLTFDGQTTGGF